MSQEGPSPIRGMPGVSQTAQKLQMQRLAAQQKLSQSNIRQQATKSEFTEWTELGSFNPLLMSKRFERLEKRLKKEAAEAETFEAEEVQGESEVTDIIEEIARDYEKKNPELNARTLLIIRADIKPEDDVDTILSKIKKAYGDPSLADDVLDFLVDAEIRDSELAIRLNKTKIQFNEMYLREIKAGKNIAQEARAFSMQGLGNPTALRDLYRDITGNPRTPTNLFEELSSQFTYEKMKTVLEFILHSIGSDLKSKGPSISPKELQRLFSEARTMQAILGLYQFFKMRMRLIKGAFAREDLTFPNRMTFEILARQFIMMIQERYPSPDRILKLAVLLGLSEEIIAQIIVFTQYRDALRNISPRLFKNDKHRQDLLLATMEALSDLEDSLEEEDEEEKEEETK